MLFERLRQIICDEFSLTEDEVTLSSRFDADLGADEIDMVDLAMSLEDEFMKEIPEETLEGFKTVEDVLNFLKE